MKKILKRTLALFLTVVMAIGVAPLAGFVGLELPSITDFFNIKAEATSYSGTCGADLTWTLDTETGILEISGTGDMTDWDWSSSAPWYRKRGIIKNVTIGNGVTSIEWGAFSGCINLTSVTIPNSVTSIGSGAFSDCTSLTSVTIPNSVISINSSMFSGCTSLTSITIPNGVKNIGASAFSGCTSLTSVTIPNSVTSIGSSAFMDCIALTQITIPDSVISIGNRSFNNTAYYNDSANWENGILYIDNHLIVAEIEISGVYEIKTGTKTISDFAFYECVGLTDVIIPDSVMNIGKHAFSGCTSLTNVGIPNGVISIGSGAFRDCDSLTSITIPDSVTCSIGSQMFYECSQLTTVIIGNGVTSIEESAFYRCSSLTNVTIGKCVKSIDQTAFWICRKLSSVTIPKSVTDIGYLAFGDCNNLTDVYYTGTEDEWNAITIGSDNECLTSATIHFNYVPEDGENETPGKLELVSTYPVNGATSVLYDDELVMTFNQNLSNDLLILDSESAIKICDYNTDKEIYRIDIDDYGAIGFDDSPIVIDDNKLTIRNALHKLVPGSKYYVSISPNIIIAEDYTTDSNKGFAGITDKDTWTFSYLSPSVKERYSLDVYFTKPNVVLSAGKNASISAVLSFNGATTFPEMTFSIDDTNVAEITEIKTESNITYATIKGKKQGSTTITVTANTVDGNIVKKFPVFVSDPETVYYCNYIDGRFNNSNPFYLSGMYEESGMYIDDFKHTENNDGSVNAVFTVYNFEHCYGTVDIYDENGNLVDYEVIDMYIGEYQTDIFSHIGYTWELTEGVVTGEMFDRNEYKSEVWCKKTEISIVVPQNGYYVISNNISTSKGCLAYNISTLLVEMLLKSNNFIDKLTDILSKKDLLSISANSEKIAKAFSEEFLKELIKKGSDKVTEDLIEALIEFSVESQAKSAVGVDKVLDCFEDCLNELGMDVFKTIKKSILNVLKTSIVETALNVLFELSLKKCGKDFVDLLYYTPITVSKWLATADSIQKHTDSTSVYIYNHQNNSMRKSNGIVSYTTENYDTVFHTVILKSGDKVDYINRLTGEQEKAKVYDISLIRDGKSVQPKDSVTVYIPIPNGWNTYSLTLYHISKETGKREKIPVEIENGYAKFVTDSFSYFILSTDELKFVDTFGIKTPSTTTISYGDTLILHAVVESVPNGTSIVWETSNDGVSIKPSDDGLSCAVTSVKTNTASVSAKLVDDNGNIVTNFDGEELTASQIIKSKAGFFQKIIAFFKKLFGLTKIIDQSIDTI